MTPQNSTAPHDSTMQYSIPPRGPRVFVRTLRGRLLLVLVGATLLGLLTMGVTSVTLMRGSLMSKMDERLVEISRPWEHGRPPPIPPDTPPDAFSGQHGRHRLPTEFRVQFFDPAGHRVGDVLGPSESDPSVPVIIKPDLDSRDDPVTVPGSNGGPDWRVRMVHLPDGRTAALALSLESVTTTVNGLMWIELAVGAVVVVVLTAIAAVTVRLGLRPLTRIEGTADAIAAGELDRRIPDQDIRTETGRLGAALNTMLGRLVSALQDRERSEQRLRRFIADASHELRTPLTSIRGFAELYRRNEQPRNEDVRVMMSRIEGEALRMSDLVEDLLLLARLDRERTIETVSLDLTPLVQEVVHDGQARDPDREISLTALDTTLRVLGNEHRMRQILNNLVTNALVHTEPATPVDVSIRQGFPRDDVTAASGTHPGPRTAMGIVEIADSGPGIAPDQAGRIFDRFYRVDDGRSEGGTGLGLAITAALAEAHDGRVELAANSTGGSTFRLLLPLSAPEDTTPTEHNPQ